MTGDNARVLRKRPRTRRGVTAAIALGVVGGMRAGLPPAVLAVRDKRPKSRLLRLGIILGSAGELVADKLPSTPSRIAAPGLAGRFASGGAVGRQCAGTFGGLLGGASAVGSGFVSHNARRDLVKKTGLPDPVIAVAEDSIAIALARFATRRPLDTPPPATDTGDAAEKPAVAAKPPKGRKARRAADSAAASDADKCRGRKRRKTVTAAKSTAAAKAAQAVKDVKASHPVEAVESALPKRAKRPKGRKVKKQAAKAADAARGAAADAARAAADAARAARAQASHAGRSARRSASPRPRRRSRLLRRSHR